MIQYPLRFEAHSECKNGVSTNWISRAGALETQIAIPPEFLGPGGGLSPEDLFNQALANCFLATFKVYAENSKLAFESVSVKSELIVAPDESNKPVMKEFFLQAKIRGSSNPEKAKLLARKASESGFVLNSVKTKCRFEFAIE